MTERIKEKARAHLATDGPNLSLRAVARDLDIVSSNIYRYFTSRDDLLTALIIDAYASLGEEVETAEAKVPRGQLVNRYLEVGRSTRRWARQHPDEYALVYGSPVPGYVAPRETVEQAQRPLLVTMQILREAYERGHIMPLTDRLPKPVRADVERIAALPGFDGLPPALLARGMTTWALLYGTISFELFGRYANAVENLDDYFDHQLRVIMRYLGLIP